MKGVRILCLMALFVCLAAAAPALAQGEELTLRLSRDWGYGGFNNDIQGTFSMKVTGPDDLARVEFYIDDAQIGEDTSAPFKFQFVTDNYPLGAHSLWAMGYAAGGQELRSQAVSATFVPASATTGMLLKIFVPLAAVIVGAILLAALVSIVTGRKLKSLPPGTPRQYPLGGAVCPKCGRPFAMHLLGLNLLSGKLDRCPYCGKWSVVRRVPLAKLRDAEQAELEAAQGPVPETPEEEKLRQKLDDSKYQGL
jgi:DNA-directed RNA polymerase subunit RPC12/RpoP